MNIKKVLQYIALIFSFWVLVRMLGGHEVLNVLKALRREGTLSTSAYMFLLFFPSVIGLVAYPIVRIFFRYLYQKNSQVALAASNFDSIYENNLLKFSTYWFFFWLCLQVVFKLLFKLLPARSYDGEGALFIMLLVSLFFLAGVIVVGIYSKVRQIAQKRKVSSASEKAEEEALSMPELLGKNSLVYLFWFVISFVGSVVILISYFVAKGEFNSKGPVSGDVVGLFIILGIFGMLGLGGIGLVGVIIETRVNKRLYRIKNIKKVLLVVTILISIIIALAVAGFYNEREHKNKKIKAISIPTETRFVCSSGVAFDILKLSDSSGHITLVEVQHSVSGSYYTKKYTFTIKGKNIFYVDKYNLNEKTLYERKLKECKNSEGKTILDIYSYDVSAGQSSASQQAASSQSADLEKKMYSTTTQQPTSSPQPAAAESFFEVKELGFKIPLGDNFKIGELTYTISADNKQSVKLSTKRLRALSEKCQDGSIGTITKIIGAVPSDAYYMQKNIPIPINVSLGAFYLSYEKQTAPCDLGEAASWQTYVIGNFSQVFSEAVLSE